MRVLICGIDGYIGWSLALQLSRQGHEVFGIDNLFRRKAVAEVGSDSAIPILPVEDRVRLAKKNLGYDIEFSRGDMANFEQISGAIRRSNPDAIVHLAEQPSAPYSMIDRQHAVYTEQNNVIGTLNLLFAMREEPPRAHLVKLGTLGEYGTPNVEIPEGFFEIERKGRKDRLPFPRQAGSFYHWSKVHDSGNVWFACKLWNLRSTDVMQGVVYGTRTESDPQEELFTRFDFDEVFGTVVNRFCAQAAIGLPLTPYGIGKQRRGFIALVDSVQCLTLAIDNPPDPGEYRVFNQLDEVYSVGEIAASVKNAGKRLGLDVEVTPVHNPRMEMEDHFYEVDRSNLERLGFKPTRTLGEELTIILKDLIRYKDRIEARKDRITPTVEWRTGRKAATFESSKET